MFEFIPDEVNEATQVPYFEDATKEGGWQGHATSKSQDTLKAELTKSIMMLGGQVLSFRRGRWTINEQLRYGFEIKFVMEPVPDGPQYPARLNIAALPLRPVVGYRRDAQRIEAGKIDKTLRMALYMATLAMEGSRFLQTLSPGYAALIPWMLGKDNKTTLTESWSDGAGFAKLLPPNAGKFKGDEDAVDGEYREAD